MEPSVDVDLRNEDLRLYFSEVKDTHQETEFEEEEHVVLNGNTTTIHVKHSNYLCFSSQKSNKPPISYTKRVFRIFQSSITKGRKLVMLW